MKRSLPARVFSRDSRSGIVNDRVYALLAVRPEGYIVAANNRNCRFPTRTGDLVLVSDCVGARGGQYTIEYSWDRTCKRKRVC